MTDANPREFSNADFLDISLELEKHNAIFYRLWQLGRPSFTTEIATGAVAFNKEGDCIDFLINPDFWDSLNQTQRLFLLSHECLHVILNHGVRMSNIKRNSTTNRILNIARDNCVNHALVTRFGFEREEVDPENRFIWHDKLFDPKIYPEPVPTGKNFEFYYNLIKKKVEEYEAAGGGGADPLGGTGEPIDSHDLMENPDPDTLKDVMDRFNKSATDEEREAVQDFLEGQFTTRQAGTAAGCMVVFGSKKRVRKKKKWETVIKNWVTKALITHWKPQEQWARLNRRFAALPTDMFVPTEMEIEDDYNEKDKLNLWFFQDTSGSCLDFAQRFFAAAKSIPTKRFNIRLFCFDTKVKETDLVSGRLYGFGGTSFECIEKFILKTGEKYPDAVFIITDGHGDHVSPKHPKRWYWFIQGDYTVLVPKESKHYRLSDFE